MRGCYEHIRPFFIAFHPYWLGLGLRQTVVLLLFGTVLSATLVTVTDMGRAYPKFFTLDMPSHILYELLLCSAIVHVANAIVHSAGIQCE